MRRSLFALLLALPLSAAAQPSDGAEVWHRHCVTCHGDDGRGQTEQGRKLFVPDLTRKDWQSSRSDEQIRSAIREGSESGMPEFKDKLAKKELDALVRFVRHLGPQPGR